MTKEAHSPTSQLTLTRTSVRVRLAFRRNTSLVASEVPATAALPMVQRKALGQ